MTGCSASFEATRWNFSTQSILNRDRTAWSMNRSQSSFMSAMAARTLERTTGEIGIIDAQNDKVVGDTKVVAHPSELLLDKAGKTLFVFVSIADKLQVIDTNKREVLSTWRVTSQRPGDAAFDESTSRLFLGTRTPAEMVVMDSKSGKEVAHLPMPEGMDGVYFDAGRKRVYVSGGRDLPVGFVYVYQQKDADHYETIDKIPTRRGSGTSFWSLELNRYYVAAPATDKEEAAILVYAPQD